MKIRSNPNVLIRIILAFCLFFTLTLQADESPPKAAIVSAHPLATRAGLDIFRQGGNAFDAAVAVTAVLAVVEPYSSGLGGGGFYLLHTVDTDTSIMLDAREKAPLAAHRDMYLNKDGQIIKGLSINGSLAAGIPGIPAALAHLAEQYGQLSLEQSLAPAIRLAKEGFPVDKRYRRMAGFRRQAMQAGDAKKIFLHKGKPPEIGTPIQQPDLAHTLKTLAREGNKGFYQGETAKKLVKGVRQAGGIWTMEDLAQYRVVERTPVTGQYKGWQITSVSPPSSGGIALMEILNILAGYPLEELNRVERVNLVVEAMRRAYRDRAVYLGDSDFVSVPQEKLLNPYYAAGLRAAIHPGKATPSDLLAPDEIFPSAGTDTTHFSIIDTVGNRVAATLSINYPFGSGFVPAGTGVLLNDEMDDFSSKPNTPNVYGLVGGDANAIAPAKRPLSSMSPTFMERGETVAILGTPGGSRIISMVLLAILELDAGKNIEQIVNAPRFHHQYLPDRLQHEPGTFSTQEEKLLRGMGYVLKEIGRRYGNMQAVLWDKQHRQISAASDPRGMGSTGYYPE